MNQTQPTVGSIEYALQTANADLRKRGIKEIPASILNTGRVDLGKIVPGKKPTQQQALTPPDARQTQQFVPVPQTEPFASEENAVLSEIEKLKADIAPLEERVANSKTIENQAFEDAGIFEDMQELNRMKDRLRTLQDRDIEIPIEQRQKLRGNQATKTDLEKTTRPLLEQNTLETLAQSRATDSFSRALQTNASIVLDRLEGEQESAEFNLKRKDARLKELETKHGDIITKRQQQRIEEQRFQNEVDLMALRANTDLKKELALKLVDYGVGGSKLQRAMDGGVAGLMQTLSEIERPASYNDMLDQLKYTQALTEFNDEQTAKVAIERRTKGEAQASADAIINDMLGNDLGFGSNTGFLKIPNKLRDNLGIFPDADLFVATATNILNNLTIDQLKKLKEETGAVGQTTEREWPRYEQASARLARLAEQKDGVFTGRFTGSAETVRQLTKEVATGYMKLYLNSAMTSDEFLQKVDGVTDYQSVLKIYNDTKNAQTLPNATKLQQIDNALEGQSFNAVPIGTGQQEAVLGGSVGYITGYGSPLWKYGLDVQLKGDNAPVRAPMAGTVEFTGNVDGFGNKVRLRLDDGRAIQMGHLSRINAKPGQRIAIGDVIGTQGNSGKTIGKTGIHVDYTLYGQDGKPLPVAELIKSLNSPYALT